MVIIESQDGHDVTITAPSMGHEFTMPNMNVGGAPTVGAVPVDGVATVGARPSLMEQVPTGSLQTPLEGGLQALALVGFAFWRLSLSKRRMAEISSRNDVHASHGLSEAQERAAFIARYGARTSNG